MLQARSLLNRNLYHSKIADEAQSDLTLPTKYLDFNSDIGLARLQNSNGDIFYGQAQTNGAVGKGDNIRLRRGMGLQKYDSMPHLKQSQTISQSVKTTQDFIIWNTGYTRNGVVNRAVDWFSGISNRDSIKWKKGTSDADAMPDIKGLKLIYIPMIFRSLSEQELFRLRKFQSAGGITFVTGEHATFSQERQKANEIMMALNSPLRCVDDTSTYRNISNLNYPATFQEISILFGIASCKITGGQSISIIPESNVTPGTNIVWIAYDKDSRTILSGDIDWASDATPITENDNAKFAKSLLKLKW